MSVLVNMEMPKSCGYCHLRHEARDGDECYLGASLTEYQKRPDDCPLVPIQPHGRLIDADALEASCFMGSSSFYTQSDIDYAPTIIPASEEDE